jgi:LuxR family transcriptional regulator, quorum-sensing system regulator CciR
MRITFADELISSILAAQTDEDLHSALADASRRMGFDHFALSYNRRPGRANSHKFLLHNYPNAWAQIYTAFDLSANDPVQRTCQKSLIGFVWSEIEDFVTLSRGDLNMMAIGRDNGIADGYTVPRHLPGEGGGSCTFAVNPDNFLPEDMLYVAELVGAVAVFNSLRRVGNARKGTLRPLSERQRECLLWSARGKTNAEIAIILDISEETVSQHLRAARERYEVHCRQQLILCALFDGLISFVDIFDWWRKE